jgi:hypothetical protein
MEDGKNLVDVSLRCLLGMDRLVADSAWVAIVDFEPGAAVGTVDSSVDRNRP